MASNNENPTPREGRWNFASNSWEERTGKRGKKNGKGKSKITWGPWKPATRSPSSFNFPNVAKELGQAIAANQETPKSASICGIAKRFHKSNAAVKKKIRKLIERVAAGELQQKKGEADEAYAARIEKQVKAKYDELTACDRDWETASQCRR